MAERREMIDPVIILKHIAVVFLIVIKLIMKNGVLQVVHRTIEIMVLMPATLY